MRAFSMAVFAVVVLAITAAIGLSFIQKSSAQAYATEAARLDQNESVNIYGRAGSTAVRAKEAGAG
jgi:predicted membrane-bound mannosyltransferase